jgi:hypothetical protein
MEFYFNTNEIYGYFIQKNKVKCVQLNIDFNFFLNIFKKILNFLKIYYELETKSKMEIFIKNFLLHRLALKTLIPKKFCIRKIIIKILLQSVFIKIVFLLFLIIGVKFIKANKQTLN